MKLKNLFRKISFKKSNRILPLADFYDDRQNCVILDTETTGLDSKCRIIEIAILSGYGELLYDKLINPQMHIPEAATVVNHITDEMVKGQPTFLECAYDILRILEGKKVIAWNADFDSRIVNSEFSRVLTMPVKCEWYCAMKYFCRVYGIESGRISLAKAYKKVFGHCSDVTSHRALCDCMDTLDVLDNMKRF